MNIQEYPDQEFMMMKLADTIAGELRSCLTMHDHASFAVPGGTTPGPIFDDLSGVDLDWSRIHVFLTDERLVPPDHPRSNERLVRERLLTGHAKDAPFVRYVPHGDLAGADAAQMSRALDGELPISVLVLGMGADMHTASLFPGAEELHEALTTEHAVVAVTPPGDDLEPRVSLSARSLKNAMTTHVVITGAEKRAALERAMTLPPEEAPIRLVLDEATVHWAE